jgi:hypothetical protein
VYTWQVAEIFCRCIWHVSKILHIHSACDWNVLCTFSGLYLTVVNPYLWSDHYILSDLRQFYDL